MVAVPDDGIAHPLVGFAPPLALFCTPPTSASNVEKNAPPLRQGCAFVSNLATFAN